jgi:hypothetical protein
MTLIEAEPATDNLGGLSSPVDMPYCAVFLEECARILHFNSGDSHFTTPLGALHLNHPALILGEGHEGQIIF